MTVGFSWTSEKRRTVFLIKHGGNVKSLYLSTGIAGRSHVTDWSVMCTPASFALRFSFRSVKMNEFSSKVEGRFFARVNSY